MQILARVSAFAIVGLFLLNVVLGIIEGLVTHRVHQGGAQDAGLSRSSGRGSGTVADIGEALTADVQFFANRVMIDVEAKRGLQLRQEPQGSSDFRLRSQGPCRLGTGESGLVLG